MYNCIWWAFSVTKIKQLISGRLSKKRERLNHKSGASGVHPSPDTSESRGSNDLLGALTHSPHLGQVLPTAWVRELAAARLLIPRA